MTVLGYDADARVTLHVNGQDVTLPLSFAPMASKDEVLHFTVPAERVSAAIAEARDDRCCACGARQRVRQYVGAWRS